MFSTVLRSNERRTRARRQRVCSICASSTVGRFRRDSTSSLRVSSQGDSNWHRDRKPSVWNHTQWVAHATISHLVPTTGFLELPSSPTKHQFSNCFLLFAVNYPFLLLCRLFYLLFGRFSITFYVTESLRGSIYVDQRSDMNIWFYFSCFLDVITCDRDDQDFRWYQFTIQITAF